MKLNCICIFCVLLGASGMARSQDKPQFPYRQKVHRDDRYFSHWLHGGKGHVTLTEDSLLFKTDKARNSVFNFALAYCEIKSIRTWYFFLSPNRIRIKVINDGSYRLFTYKRKNIIALTREKMAACRKSQDKPGVLYSQKAERDDMFFSKVFYPRNGRIYLTNDSLVFKAKDVYNDVFNFSIAVCDIRYIRNYYGAVLPNRIRIMTKHTGSVRILAYRKGKLKRLTRQQMAACAAP